jgi:TonB family protein
MMTKRKFRTSAILRLLIVIPLSAVLIIAVASCAASRKAAKTQKEILPPPTPSPQVPIKKEVPSTVFVVVEEMPVFPGGDQALMEFIYKNVVYPKEAKDKNIQGRVITRFVVKADGSVGDIQVLKGVDPLLDSESIRVLKLLPKWQPGKQGGQPVNVWYSIPITFNLAPNGLMNRPRYIITGNDTIYLDATKKPMFTGGNYALYKFKRDNLKYTDVAKSNLSEGSVTVQFIVNENGLISDFLIPSSGGISPSLDAEALRIAKLMPAWQPGKENGRAVKVRTSTTFDFYLTSSTNANSVALKDVYVVVEDMPIFPGGDTTLMKFIVNNIQYPKNAKEKNIQGRVILRFCVTSEGKIAKIGVLKGVDPELDAEAIRVIKMLPDWQPGMQGGRPVNVWYSVPISFKLSGPAQANNPQAQIAPPPPPPVQSMPNGYDEPPVFNGGESALFKFIQSNLVYPKEAKEKGVSGTVVIKFCITETGSVENVNIGESLDPLLDTEALRVVKLMPAWQPGKLKGVPVKVFYNLPIVFKLH